MLWNITEDKTGNLWFGTSGGGVSRYDGKSFINFTTAQGLADDMVYDIMIDSQENIFIGTNLGFSVLKGFKSLAPNPSKWGNYPGCQFSYQRRNQKTTNRYLSYTTKKPATR